MIATSHRVGGGAFAAPTTARRPLTPTTMTPPNDEPGATDDPGATDEPTLETVAELLDDAHVRTVLTATSVDPMSARELSERCDASRATVYRRLEALEAAGLVAERTRPRADGHHDAVYVATLDELSIRLRDGELELELDRRDGDAAFGPDLGSDDVADRLTRMWEDF